MKIEAGYEGVVRLLVREGAGVRMSIEVCSKAGEREICFRPVLSIAEAKNFHVGGTVYIKCSFEAEEEGPSK